MENAKKLLKSKLKAKVAEIAALRKQMFDLKWTGPLPAIQKDASGRKVSGKKARKPFHNPSTGMERWSLWYDKRRLKDEARGLNLAYGFIRGRSYKTLEPKCKDTKSPYTSDILHALTGCLSPEEKLLFTDQALVDWLQGGEAPRLPKAA